ncbi:diguanylate cyclase/phosphodiesterase (GGDEF & EAL domains) with PAS/PAC sensor(s) [hydrothermal vent metagenome]|uniref:Diguanylate cyclase/phosphodiesterase (GGDEF & EAL domains) with PAS/PAC sensor(S) n=1 Tax=hydrothermal vent metagenome TaxID=652676 RepID=A0A3B0ZK76_9ZZZZ
MKAFFSTLTGRIAIAALSIFLVIVPLLFGVVLYLVKKNYENQFVDHVRNDAYQLASVSQSGGGFERLENELEEALIGGRVAFSHIVDNKGYLITGGRPGRLTLPFEEDFFFGQAEDILYQIIVPLFDASGKGIGELRLGYDETPVRMQTMQAYKSGLYIMLGFIIIIFPITMLLGRQFANPIHQLGEAAKRITHGDYDTGLQVRTNISEIKNLAELLDHMRHELVQKNNEMQHQAHHDYLTDLPNRALLQKRVNAALKGARGSDNGMAFLLIDLDRFKQVNDMFGHLTGDAVLKLAAERIQSCIRKTDTAARLGGDEFALLLPATGGGSAEAIARLVSERLREAFNIAEHHLKLGSSIGIALYPEHGDSYERILHCSDIAMYAAKREDRGVVIWRPELETEAPPKAETETV